MDMRYTPTEKKIALEKGILMSRRCHFPRGALYDATGNSNQKRQQKFEEAAARIRARIEARRMSEHQDSHS